MFNAALGSWVAVPEHSRTRGGNACGGAVVAGLGGAMSALIVALTPVQAAVAQVAPTALPTGERVVSGAVSVTRNAGNDAMTLTQQGTRGVVSWDSFNIGKNASVTVVQPNASAVLMNRVTGSDPTQVFGQLTANGRVFLVNPNGVTFGNGAAVSVGSLVASTLDITDDQFAKDGTVFQLAGNSKAAVRNEGGSGLTANGGANGGIALLAATVVNNGTISAPKGTVAMAGGQGMTLNLGGPMNVTVTSDAVQALVDNGGIVSAAGGTILLTAKGAKDLTLASINQSGTLDASSLGTDKGGRIVLETPGVLEHAGTSSATAKDGDGGRIDVTARQFNAERSTWRVSSEGGNGGSLSFQFGADGASMQFLTADASGGRNGGSIGVASEGWIDHYGGSSHVDGRDGMGGRIDIASKADDVALGASTVTANGGAGGGSIRVVPGKNASADIDAGAVLRANAISSGDGGTIEIGLSYGTSASLQAKGSATGRGGTLELSNVEYAPPTGMDVSGGKGGGKVTVSGDHLSVVTTVDADRPDVSTATLNSLLDRGADVTLRTDSDLTVAAALSSSGTGTLKLQSGRSLLINGNLALSNATVDLGANQGGGNPSTRGAGAGHLTMARNTSVQADTLTLAIGDGGGAPGATPGTMTLAKVLAKDLTIKMPSMTGTFLANDKVYDGLISVDTHDWSVNQLVLTPDSNLVLITDDAWFDDRRAGVGKTVSGQFTLSGSGGDVRVTDATGEPVTFHSSATITPKTLHVDLDVADKTYDGNTDATFKVNRLNGILMNDQVATSGGIARFDSSSAGAGKRATVSNITLTGADSGNYTLGINPLVASADIAQRLLTVSLTAKDKFYDGTTFATTELHDDRLAVDQGSDQLTIVTSDRTFSDRNAGWGKTVTASVTGLAGLSSGNYRLASSDVSTTASILRRLIAPSATVTDKVYDGSTAAQATVFAGNTVQGDVVKVLSASATFDTKNAGTNKLVEVTGLSLDGADRDNYQLSALSTEARASILQRQLSVNAAIRDKVYDGTTAARVDSFSTDKVAGDDLVVTNVQSAFTTKDVGSNKEVTVTGVALSGRDKDNYRLVSSTVRSSADITPRTLALTALASNKVYDGNTDAQVRLSDDRIATDSLTVATNQAHFADKQAGREKRVVIDGIHLTGADSGNYVVVSALTDRADITPRVLHVNVNAADKVYDGTTAAQVSLSDDRDDSLKGDLLTISHAPAQFSDKNAGMAKTVQVSDVRLSGADQGNYVVARTTIDGRAAIMPRALRVAASVADKVYDGGDAATITRLTDNRVDGDMLTVAADDARFSDKNAARDKTVTVSGLRLSGDDRLNYLVDQDPVTAQASITPRELVVRAQVDNKTYDGLVKATIGALRDDRVSGDQLEISASGAHFDTRHAGRDKTATVDGLHIGGQDSGNYVLAAAPVTAFADIAPRTLHVSAQAQDKTYDGNTAAMASLSDDRVAGDELTVTSTSSTFDDRNAGRDKTVTVAGLALEGEHQGNYVLDSAQARTRANITPRALPVTVSSTSKHFDGTDLSTVRVDAKPLPGDDVSVRWREARFDDANPGIGKSVTVSGLQLAGADASNYQLVATQASSDDGVILPQPVLQGAQAGCSSSSAAACSAGNWLLAPQAGPMLALAQADAARGRSRDRDRQGPLDGRYDGQGAGTGALRSTGIRVPQATLDRLP